MEKIVRDTTKDLFENTLKLARESGALADMDAILDYVLPAWDGIQLSDYRFDTYFVVELGGSEGVYISAFIDGQDPRRKFEGAANHGQGVRYADVLRISLCQ